MEKIFNFDLEISYIDYDFAKTNLIEILNSRMSNGRTLIYLVCQDGNYTVVKYLLSKNLNPSIKSKIGEREYENCLEVACRWSFSKIVELLIKSNKFSFSEISECLKIKGLTKNMKILIKKYLNKIKSSKKCLCF